MGALAGLIGFLKDPKALIKSLACLAGVVLLYNVVTFGIDTFNDYTTAKADVVELRRQTAEKDAAIAAQKQEKQRIEEGHVIDVAKIREANEALRKYDAQKHSDALAIMKAKNDERLRKLALRCEGGVIPMPAALSGLLRGLREQTPSGTPGTDGGG